MPGILPMKVIKVGTSSQSRIAQACDRCRSKKIRCDGIRPCCSQCANVGFECRTSDKLSRRAFPRGYTESLEERVRLLESEVRELKDLLDEKEEKIELLSKMHSNHRHSSIASQIPPSSPAAASFSSPTATAAAAAASPSAASTATASTAASTSSASTSDLLSRQSSTSSASSASPGPGAQKPDIVVVSADGASAGSARKSDSSTSPCIISSSAALKAKRDARGARASATPPPAREDTFRVQASPLLLGVENSDSYFMGASSGRSFIDTFKRKMQENGKSCSDFHPEAFLHIQGCYPLVEHAQSLPMRVPPRIFTDRCVNVYFQEWSALFPVLHRPAFLRIYDDFVSDPDKVKNQHKLTQLYLVFAIAALSVDQPDLEQIAVCERHWQRSLDAVLMDNTILTLQCLVLALLYCTVRADYKRLQYYKGIAVSLSHRLGLHQSQRRFSFGALTIETRKKVFWTLYTLDCFSAAVLGLPKLLKDEDIHTEYPTDTDDEYVTEKGFQPTLPGESTRVSAALALFRVARILAKVLESNYPAATTHELSLQQMSLLESELVEWRDALPPHLTLTFRQEKPSTDVTGNRSPLLSLAYYYIRTLIWRPAVGSTLGAKAGPAMMAISDCSKHMVQIVELLEERNMSFSLCINKPDLMVVCGMTLLYQSMGLKPDSKMLKDTERLVNSTLRMADAAKAPGCYDFKRVAALLVTVDEALLPMPGAAALPLDAIMSAPPARRGSQSGSGGPRKSSVAAPSAAFVRHSSMSMSEADLLMQQEKLRRMTLPVNAAAKAELRSRSRSSFDSPRDQLAPNRLPLSQAQMLSRLSQLQQQQYQNLQRMVQQQKKKTNSNLDYLALDGSVQDGSLSPSSPAHGRQQLQQQQHYYATPAAPAAAEVSPADWEALLGSMDGGQLNVYDAIYGGPAIGLGQGAGGAESTMPPPSATPQSSGEGWSPDVWDFRGFSLGDMGSGGGGGPESSSSGPGSVPPPAQSVLSFSDESLSGDDLASTDLASLGLGSLDLGSLDYRGGGMMDGGCGVAAPDGFVMENLDGSSFVL